MTPKTIQSIVRQTNRAQMERKNRARWAMEILRWDAPVTALRKRWKSMLRLWAKDLEAIHKSGGVPAGMVATVYTQLGDKDNAFK